MAVQPRFRDVSEAISEGVNSFKKWYRKVDQTSDAYFICLGTLYFLFLRCTHITHAHKRWSLVVLNLNVKHLYCQSQWESEQYEAGMERLNEVVSPSLCSSFFAETLWFALSSSTNTIFPQTRRSQVQK